VAPLVGIVGLALAVSGCASPTRTVPAPPAGVGTQLDRAVPAGVLGLPLVDQSGAARTLGSFHGKVLVISDAMTLCQETCPLDSANLVATARAVIAAGLGDRVAFATITIDPHRDTPARLAAYHDQFAPAPADWTLLTGSPDALAALWKDLGVYYQTAPEPSPPATDWLTGRPLTYDISHADLIFFIDPDGHERFVIDGPAHVAAGAPVPDALRRFLNDEGRRNLTEPDAQTWTVPQALQVVSWLTNHNLHE
jgi:protein SCO1